VVNVFVPLQRQTGKAITDSDDMLRLVSRVHELVVDNRISSNNAYELLRRLVSEGVPDDVERFAQTNGLLQVSDSSELEALVAQAIKENPKAAEDIANGEMKAVGFLVGQVMKASKGQANPQVVQTLIKQQLGL
jgi:aspartyl-tRNA(Asn)/glutamyl-tRNA(Gln) amidotransferase subunit B